MSQPFLRWTGSKRWFIKDHFEKFAPEHFGNYHEPFLGGGAVFFHLKAQKNEDRSYFLTDTNEELINCYSQIQRDPDEVIRQLKTFQNTKEQYYAVRTLQSPEASIMAARFIYLNRTSFNGIYRVNNLGLYNVPYGHRPRVDFITEKALLQTSQYLKDVHLATCGFEQTLNNIQRGDLVFIDPPYTVAHENNGFIEYNQTLFSWDDQLKLRNFIDKIVAVGAYFILTNASHPSIMSLYGDIGTTRKLTRRSQVGGRNKTRGFYNELVVSNIDI